VDDVSQIAGFLGVGDRVIHREPRLTMRIGCVEADNGSGLGGGSSGVPRPPSSARVEQAIGTLKRVKRIALRCEKTKERLQACVSNAAALLLVKFLLTA